jgi:uncharacterized protein YecE (DUF72 family)
MGGRIVIGTSSWADPGFVEEWYPPGLPARERLAWYAERFEAVEVNSTFYAVPAARTVNRWAEQTPDDFCFDVKLHRLLSRHAADLRSLPPALREEATTNERGRVQLTPRLEAALADEIIAAVAPLGGRLTSFLLQLSPAFGPRDHRLSELDGLVERLSSTAPVAVELRHRFWLHEDRIEDTLRWYEDRDAAFVCVDAPQGSRSPTIMPAVDAATRDDIAYLRAHGRNLEGYLRGRSVAERFAHRYSDEELEELGLRAQRLAEEAPTVHMMFNNNRGADAPAAAQRMRELLGQEAAAAPHT